MKKILLISLSLILLSACEKEENPVDETIEKHQYLITNITDDKIKVSESEKTEPFVLLDTNQTDTLDLPFLSSISITRKTDNGPYQHLQYRIDGNTYRVYEYNNEITYYVIGTASNAYITYETSSGQTLQKEVQVPYTIEYPTFPDNEFVYISAQNSGTNGYIKTIITYRSWIIDQDNSYSDYGIATSSGNCQLPNNLERYP